MRALILVLIFACICQAAEKRNFFLHFPVGVFIPSGSQHDMKRDNEFMLGLDVQYYFNDYIGFAYNRDFRINKAGRVDFYNSFNGIGLSVKKSWEDNDIYCNAGLAFVGAFIYDHERICCDSDNFDSSLGAYADIGWRWFPGKTIYLGLAGRYIYADDLEYMDYTYKQSGFAVMGTFGFGF